MTNEAVFRFRGEVGGAAKAADEMGDALGRVARRSTAASREVSSETGKMARHVETQYAGMRRSVATHVAGLTAVLVGAGGFVEAIRGGFDELNEGRRTTAQTNAVLASTGQVAGVSAQHVGELAEALRRKTKVDDEVIRSGENVMLTFTRVRNVVGAGNDIFDQAVTAALDLSKALGTDLQAATIQVGKALQDPIAGVTALRRVGVNFDASAKAQIKTLLDQNRVLDAQKLILRELTVEFGGAAKAAGENLGARVAYLRDRFNDLVASMLGSVEPALSRVVDRAADYFDELANTAEGQAKVQRVASQLGAVLTTLASILSTVYNGARAVADAVGGWESAFTIVGGALVLGKIASLSSSLWGAVGAAGSLGKMIGALPIGKQIAITVAVTAIMTKGVQALMEKYLGADFSDISKGGDAIKGAPGGTNDPNLVVDPRNGLLTPMQDIPPALRGQIKSGFSRAPSPVGPRASELKGAIDAALGITTSTTTKGGGWTPPDLYHPIPTGGDVPTYDTTGGGGGKSKLAMLSPATQLGIALAEEAGSSARMVAAYKKAVDELTGNLKRAKTDDLRTEIVSARAGFRKQITSLTKDAADAAKAKRDALTASVKDALDKFNPDGLFIGGPTVGPGVRVDNPAEQTRRLAESETALKEFLAATDPRPLLARWRQLTATMAEMPPATAARMKRALDQVKAAIGQIGDADDVARLTARLDQIAKFSTDAIDALRGRIRGYRDDFSSALGTVSGKVLQAFDAETATTLSAIQTRLAATTKRIQDQLTAQLATLTATVTGSGFDAFTTSAGAETPDEARARQMREETAKKEALDRIEAARKRVADAEQALAGADDSGGKRLVIGPGGSIMYVSTAEATDLDRLKKELADAKEALAGEERNQEQARLDALAALERDAANKALDAARDAAAKEAQTKIDAAEAAAAEEQKRTEQERAALRESLAGRLADIAQSFADEKITAGQAVGEVKAVMLEYGVSYESAGETLGKGFADSLVKALDTLTKDGSRVTTSLDLLLAIMRGKVDEAKRLWKELADLDATAPSGGGTMVGGVPQLPGGGSSHDPAPSPYIPPSTPAPQPAVGYGPGTGYGVDKPLPPGWERILPYIGGYASGGIIPGVPTPGVDSRWARVSPGELILTAAQQQRVAGRLVAGGGGGGGDVHVHVAGSVIAERDLFRIVHRETLSYQRSNVSTGYR